MNPDNQPHQMLVHSRRSFKALLVLFALSGAAALIYEVLWVRQLTHIFGTSTQAVTAVLTAFMGGLGIGSWAIGRLADRLSLRNLARLYIGLEVAIGVYSLCFPYILKWAEFLYIETYRVWQPSPAVDNGYKFLLSLLLLALPTICMGATLPIFSRYLIRKREKISLTVAKLYAANTLGGLAGIMAAGYVLLPYLGIRLTNFIAIGLNLLVALGVQLICPREAGEEEVTEFNSTVADSAGSPLQSAVVWAFALSGVAAMLYQVAWSRTLCMILGTTTYAFTTLVAVFLAGIAIGSFLYRQLKPSIPRLTLFVSLQAVIGISVTLSIPAFEKFPFLFLSLNQRFVTNWTELQFLRFFLAALVMIVPTVAMGMLLPVVSALVTDRTGHLGGRLGKAYGWNTIGCTLGAAMGGLLLVPGIGMQRTILLGAVLNLTAAIWVHVLQVDLSLKKRFWMPAALLAATLLIVSFLEPWAPRIMSSGPYVYAPRYEKLLQRYAEAAAADKTPPLTAWQIWDLAMKQYELLYYRTGLNATVAVMERNDGVRFLTINGKTDASTGRQSDMRTQLMIGHLPLLFHEDPREVLIVGLGSGMTAGAVLAHAVDAVDCAEISPAVIEAAALFAEENHGALTNPRLRVIPRDARSLLLTSRKTYSVIISQPSNPWIEGEANLFALEWYQLVENHLEEGGIFLQWVPSYLMAEQDFKTVLHTLRSVFPDLTVWASGSPGDVILMARKGGLLRVDFQQFMERVADPVIHAEIESIGLDPELLPTSLQIMLEDDLNQYLYTNIEEPLRRNTYDRPISEFSTPRQLARRERPIEFLARKADRNQTLEIFGQDDNSEILRHLEPYLSL